MSLPSVLEGRALVRGPFLEGFVAELRPRAAPLVQHSGGRASRWILEQSSS